MTSSPTPPFIACILMWCQVSYHIRTLNEGWCETWHTTFHWAYSYICDVKSHTTLHWVFLCDVKSHTTLHQVKVIRNSEDCFPTPFDNVYDVSLYAYSNMHTYVCVCVCLCLCACVCVNSSICYIVYAAIVTCRNIAIWENHQLPTLYGLATGPLRSVTFFFVPHDSVTWAKCRCSLRGIDDQHSDASPSGLIHQTLEHSRHAGTKNGQIPQKIHRLFQSVEETCFRSCGQPRQPRTGRSELAANHAISPSQELCLAETLLHHPGPWCHGASLGCHWAR